MKNKHKNKNSIAAGDRTTAAGTNRSGSYEKAFLNPGAIGKRGSKCIYVSAEYHNRLTRIVQVVGNDKIPLFAYVNNVLEHHFSMFGDTIATEFKDKYKTLI